MRALLAPFSWVYGLVIRGRNLGFRTGMLAVRKLPAPVISVGNLTLGGSGKTPCTIHLAREALRRGMKPAILTRGYRGTAQGTCAVSDPEQVLLGPTEAGDEAFLMARQLPGIPVIKCPDRYEGGLYGLQRFRSNVFLLDDGFQHRRLHRDVNLLLIDHPGRLLADRLLPAGRLREPLSELGRADEIVISGAGEGEDPEALRRLSAWSAGVPVSAMSYRPDALTNAAGDAFPLEALRSTKVLAFCGIASPERFRNTLMGLGVDVIEFRTFRDHHAYTEQELTALLARARDLGAERVITTEKDLVKINDRNVWALAMQAGLSGDTLERIFSRVQGAVAGF